jgi:hypothetical protein
MRFCIHCGGAIGPAGAAAGGASSAPAVGATKTGLSVTCPACGRIDVLNSQFCIFCGAQTGGLPHSKVAEPTSGANVRNQIESLSGDIAAQSRDSAEKPKRPFQGQVAVLASLVCLGLAAGGGATYLSRSLFQKPENSFSLPDKGLVVGSASPHTKVLISLPGLTGSPDGRSFIVGKTASDGTLSLPNLTDGSYDITLISDGAVKKHGSVELRKNQPTVFREDGSILPKKPQ